MPFDLIAPINSQTQPFATEQTLSFFTLMMSQGIVWGFNVTAQSTPDMTVNVSAGFGICNTNTEYKKIPFANESNKVEGFGASPSAGQSRIDLVVVRITKVSSQETKAEVVIIPGTASASPTAPILVETANLFYIVLAQVTIVGGSSQITSGQIVTSGNLVNASNVNLQPTINATTFEIYPVSRFTNTFLQVLTTANIGDNTITNAKMADNSVGTADIIDLNVTTAKIANNAVTTAKIADGGVTTAKIADGNITAAKLAGDLAFAPAPRTKWAQTYNFGFAGSAQWNGSGNFTNTNIVNTTGNFLRFDKSTSAGVAGWLIGSGSIRTSHEPRIICTLFTQGLSTNDVFWFGFMNGAPTGNAANGGAAHVALRFIFNTDGGFVPSVFDGTNQSTLSAITSYAANTKYVLSARIQGGIAYFSVNGSNEVSIATNLPPNTQALTAGMWAYADNSSRLMFACQNAYYEANA